MNIIVNEHVSPDYGPVTVNTVETTSLTNEPIRMVQITTASGISVMTYDQWRAMLAIGLSMHMQEESSPTRIARMISNG